jgi:hypothetical protein
LATLHPSTVFLLAGSVLPSTMSAFTTFWVALYTLPFVVGEVGDAAVQLLCIAASVAACMHSYVAVLGCSCSVACVAVRVAGGLAASLRGCLWVGLQGCGLCAVLLWAAGLAGRSLGMVVPVVEAPCCTISCCYLHASLTQ